MHTVQCAELTTSKHIGGVSGGMSKEFLRFSFFRRTLPQATLHPGRAPTGQVRLQVVHCGRAGKCAPALGQIGDRTTIAEGQDGSGTAGGGAAGGERIVAGGEFAGGGTMSTMGGGEGRRSRGEEEEGIFRGEDQGQGEDEQDQQHNRRDQDPGEDDGAQGREG